METRDSRREERGDGHREGLQNRPRKLPVQNVTSDRRTHELREFIYKISQSHNLPTYRLTYLSDFLPTYVLLFLPLRLLYLLSHFLLSHYPPYLPSHYFSQKPPLESGQSALSPDSERTL
jgi:hypothetical protein